MELSRQSMLINILRDLCGDKPLSHAFKDKSILIKAYLELQLQL